MLFSAPAMLWGLLAVLIPVAVHLFNFRRYRKVYFSNVERLEEMYTENRRHSSLRQWFILAARVLAIVFLVLAFARPVLPTKGAIPQQSGATAVCIYIDNSFSMESTTADGSMLDVAKEKALEVAASYSVGDRFCLLAADMQGARMHWLSRDELADAIDELQPSPAAPLVSQVVEKAATFMAQNGAPNRHLYIIGDFQRSTYDLDALPNDSLVRCTLVPLTAPRTDNIYIDTLRLDAPAYFVGGSVTVEATVHNGGNSDAEKVPVKLHIDGRERALAAVDIPAGATAKTTLRFSLDRSGWIDGTLTIDDYPITFDDRYHFSIPVGERISMVEVGDAKPNEYLQRLFASDSAIDYRTSAHTPPTIANVNFIVLNEADNLPSGEAQQLSEWVLGGGALAVLPPASGKVEDINMLLAMLGAPQFDNIKSQPIKARKIDYDNALYRGVFSAHSDESEMPTAIKHFALKENGAISQPIITLADGSTLLAVTPCGAGRVYVLSTPLNNEWTDLVNQVLFVPTLYNMALYSKPLPQVAYTLGDNTPIQLQGKYNLDEKPLELTDGQGLSLIPDIRKIAGRTTMIPHGELKHDGIYRYGDEHIAFNYPRRESVLEFYSRNEVAEAIEDRTGYSVVRNATKPLGDELRTMTGGRQLWRACILLALLFLAAETLLLKIKPKRK